MSLGQPVQPPDVIDPIAVANASAPSFPEGARCFLSVDRNGNLRILAGSGGTSSVDESTFTAGASLGVPIMGWDATSGELLIAALSPGTRKLEVAGTFSASPATSSTISNSGQLTIGTSAVEVLAANTSRTRFRIQQDGTTIIWILYGGTNPTNGNYTVALARCGGVHDGSIPALDDYQWQGTVYAISSASGGSILFTEFQP